MNVVCGMVPYRHCTSDGTCVYESSISGKRIKVVFDAGALVSLAQVASQAADAEASTPATLATALCVSSRTCSDTTAVSSSVVVVVAAL
jgi:hypothetical protein